MGIRLLLLSLLLAMASFGADGARIYLVRHAEVETVAPGSPAMPGPTVPGPALSQAGKERAEQLSKELANVKLSRIVVSKFLRTQQTAAPTAKRSGVNVDQVEQDAASLRALAQELRSLPAGAAVLVVGHSNTLPQLMQELGVLQPPQIQHTSFDNLFMLTLESGAARLETRKFGRPTP